MKQEKKSGNKWRCVICNERQSVRKVFARSFLAKDIRGFVQAANAARQRSESAYVWPESGSQASAPVGDGSPLESIVAGRTKRRNDWSEYLEPEEDDDDGTGGLFPLTRLFASNFLRFKLFSMEKGLMNSESSKGSDASMIKKKL